MTKRTRKTTLKEEEFQRAFDKTGDWADVEDGGHTLADANEDPLIGWKLGDRYHVTGVIADGGMGRVYSASCPERGRVAIKTLLPRFSGNSAVSERFRSEVVALQEAQCPHVVKMYDWGELPDGRAYFAMELVEGVSLADEIERLDGPMDARRALRITLQLCAALVPAHELGVVHRDIKPGNIVLCRVDEEEDVVKVLDFGLAKSFVREMSITNPGQLLGTPVYMSPEQCRGVPLDGRSDIYSLGILLYELLCGDPPFLYDDILDIVSAHVEETPVPPSRRKPPVKIPMPLEWMLLCCLHKKPDKRFQTMNEVHEEMGHIAAALGVELPATARR